MNEPSVKPGYYVDGNHCLWIYYPDNTCEFHYTFAFKEADYEWEQGQAHPDDIEMCDLEFLGDL